MAVQKRQSAGIRKHRNGIGSSEAEQALRNFESAAISLFQSNSELVWVHDTEYNIIRVSRGVEQTFGKGLVGEKCYRAYRGRDTVCPDCPTARLLGNGEAAFSTEQTAVDGRTYSVTCLPLTNPKGNVVAVLEHCTDITRRKEAEKELLRVNGFWSTVFNNANDAICIINVADLTIADANEAFLRKYSLTKGQAIGKTCYQITHHSSISCLSPRHTCPLTVTAASGRHSSFEHVHYDSAGNEVFLEVSAAPIYSRERGISQVVHVSKDITERKQAERALRASEENYRNSLDNSPLGIRILTVDGETLYANQSLLNIFGCTTVNELRAAPVAERYAGERYAENKVRGKQGSAWRPVTDTYEVSIIRKDGEIRHLRVYQREVKWAGEARYQAIYEDVTDYRRARETLTSLSRRLIEIQEDERRNIARELHDQVGQSLNVVNLLLQRTISAPAGDNVSLLSEAQSQVAELISRVSNLSLDLRPSMLDDLGLLDALVWYIGRYTATTNVQVDFKHFGLEREMEPEIKTTLYRVVQEALTNVARHAGVDRATVNIWADKGRLCLRIEDKGRGFDPTSLSSSNSSGVSGMQERLSLVGGTLNIESAPEKGTCIIAEIPLGNASEGDEKTR